MAPALNHLVLAAIAWIAVHVGLAGTGLRGLLARRIGETGFRILFSLASVVTITWLVICYRAARTDTVQLWTLPAWGGWLLVLAMAAAFVLLVGAATIPNPTAVGGEALLGREPQGLLRITRHPMLWSFAIWSAVHIAGNGDLVSLLFFGAFGITALAGMPSIDHKLARRNPAGWAGLAASTSILPFGAILGGRNLLVPREIGWVAPLGGLALWLLLLWAHPWVFGVSPVPR